MAPIGVQDMSGMAGLGGGRLDAIRRMDAEHGRDAAARELQTVLFAQLIDAMRKTLPDSDLAPKSPARDVYDGLFDRELANVLASSDPIGLIGQLGGDGQAAATSVSADDAGSGTAFAHAQQAYRAIAGQVPAGLGSAQASRTADAMMRAVAPRKI